MVRKERLALRYAKAFFEMVKGNELEKTERELSLISSTISKNPKIFKILSNPAMPFSEKKILLKRLFEDTSGKLLSFLFLLMEKRDLNLLPIILVYFHKLIDKERNRVRAVFTSAFRVKEELKEALIEKLKKILKKEVVLEVKIDENIIGGGILQIGSKRIDGSILGYLKSLDVMIRG